MPTDSPPPPSEFEPHPLWRFSVALYGEVGVKATCLTLQDEHGVDVNVVLACLWHERRGAAPLTATDIRTLLAASEASRACVQGVRTWRRVVAETARDSALYRALLHAELLAEHAVQTELHRVLADAPTAPAGRGLSSVRAYAAEAKLVVSEADILPLLDASAPT